MTEQRLAEVNLTTVVELTGKLAELFPHVPVFSRHPIRVGNEENRFNILKSIIPHGVS